MIPFWIKVLALGLILAALVAACHHRDSSLIEEGATKQRAVDQAETDKLKAEATLKLEAVLKDKSETERKLQETANVQSLKDTKNVRSVADLTRRLADLTRDTAGRLRDPYATPSGCGPSSSGTSASTAAAPSAGASNPTETTGLLSTEFTRFFQQKDIDADAINLAYISCRETVMEKTP